jgi:hypothetical protein
LPKLVIAKIAEIEKCRHKPISAITAILAILAISCLCHAVEAEMM